VQSYTFRLLTLNQYQKNGIHSVKHAKNVKELLESFEHDHQRATPETWLYNIQLIGESTKYTLFYEHFSIILEFTCCNSCYAYGDVILHLCCDCTLLYCDQCTIVDLSDRRHPIYCHSCTTDYQEDDEMDCSDSDQDQEEDSDSDQDQEEDSDSDQDQEEDSDSVSDQEEDSDSVSDQEEDSDDDEDQDQDDDDYCYKCGEDCDGCDNLEEKISCYQCGEDCVGCDRPEEDGCCCTYEY